VTNGRAFLLDALRRIVAGGTVTGEEFRDTARNPRDLDGIEQAAWLRFSQWMDDDDVRARDPQYADMQARQIAAALADLEALEAGYSPDEVEWGEHQASKLPRGCCLVLIALLAGALMWLWRQLF